MSKGPSVQEQKAEIRETLVQWFAKSVKYCDGQYYHITDDSRRIVKRLSADDCSHIVRHAGRKICETRPGGLQLQMWATDIKQILEHASTVLMVRGQDKIVAVGDTPLDGDYSSRPYAMNRLPVDFGLPDTIPQDDRPAALEVLMEKLPEFYHDLRSRMVSAEMWDILTCFFGRVVSEDTPSEEFVYWWGEGGDGKGSLTDLFFRNLPETACPIAHENFESRFGAGVYGEKRFVRIDEAPPGNFFSERVKEVTGGAKFINIERKGKDAVTVRSRLAVMFTSNYSPAFDGSMAQKRRIRVIECSQRTSPPRKVDNELDASFDVFLAYCLINYARHGKQIPENHPEHLERLCSDTNLRADSWIVDNIEYNAGGWMASTEIMKVFNETSKSSKLSYERMMRRFQTVMQSMSTDGGVVMPRKRGNQRGWQNVARRHKGITFG